MVVCLIRIVVNTLLESSLRSRLTETSHDLYRQGKDEIHSQLSRDNDFKRLVRDFIGNISKQQGTIFPKLLEL